jgi:hypothetical protein
MERVDEEERARGQEEVSDRCAVHTAHHHALELCIFTSTLFAGCGKSASYGLLGQTVRIACSIHRSPQHVAMNQRGCHVCGRRAYWGMPGGGVERYCTMHRQDGHVDVVSRRCEEKGCAKRPVFGNGERASLLQFMHGANATQISVHTCPF